MVKNATQRRHVISRQPVTEPEGHLKEGEKLVWAAAYALAINQAFSPRVAAATAASVIKDMRKFYKEQAQTIKPDDARHMLDDMMER
jgi:hypothetical protein